ncbi:MAG: hypothetical protein ABI311_11380 [Gemmatimonadaceae bacterium]
MSLSLKVGGSSPLVVSVDRSARSLRKALFHVVLVCFASTLPAAASAAQRVPLLPVPSGTHSVGTRYFFFVDSSRPDPTGRKGFGGRAIPVQMWYPAAAGADGPRAPYISRAAMLDAIVRQRYYGVDSTLLADWAGIVTHSRVRATVLPGKHPLVTLSAGLGVATANYTAIAEDLASHGYIVAGIDHPYEGVAVLPGDIIVTADDDTANSSDDAAVQRHQISSWATDISFVLDRLQHSRVDSGESSVAHAIDWSRVGAFGHSSGGLIAVQACEHDARLRACVNLDGGPADPQNNPIADFVNEGLRRPTLFLLEQPIYSDSDLARRHMTRAQFESGRGNFAALVDSLKRRARAPFYLGRIAGTGHFSFSDAPFVMPTTITRFGGRIIDGRRGLRIITVVLRTFFQQNFAMGDGARVTDLSTQFGELTFQVPSAGR